MLRASWACPCLLYLWMRVVCVRAVCRRTCHAVLWGLVFRSFFEEATPPLPMALMPDPTNPPCARTEEQRDQRRAGSTRGSGEISGEAEWPKFGGSSHGSFLEFARAFIGSTVRAVAPQVSCLLYVMLCD
jgi:hypothetical protein